MPIIPGRDTADDVRGGAAQGAAGRQERTPPKKPTQTPPPGPPGPSGHNDEDGSTPDTGAPTALPGGGTFYQVGDEIHVYYLVGDDQTKAYVKYVFSAEDWQVSNPGELEDGGSATEEQIQAKYGETGVVDGGNGKELWSIKEPTYNDWFRSAILAFAKYNRVAAEDPEVFKVIIDGLVNTLSLSEVEGRLIGTTWWQSRSEQGRAWDNMSDAHKQQELAKWKASLTDFWQAADGEGFGYTPDPDDARLVDLATKVASGAMSYVEATDTIHRWALEDDNSAASKRERQYNQRPVDIENTKRTLQDQSRLWGISLSDSSLQRWATGIVDNNTELTQADYDQFLIDQAEIHFGSREAGTSNRGRLTAVNDWAQPWMEAYAELMEEQNTTELLFNHQVRQALTDGTSLADFKTQVRKTDAWKGTENARNDMVSKLYQVGRMMGFE